MEVQKFRFNPSASRVRDAVLDRIRSGKLGSGWALGYFRREEVCREWKCKVSG
jgi:hypothetical protein